MLGQVVEDRYLIEAALGEGAMGRVYRARHIKVGRPVAIKVMHRDHARVPTIVERFAREAMIAARLRHPNVVSVLDVGTTPDRLPMIVLELAPGDPLSHLIDGPLATARVINLVSQLLRGLDHAHSAGLIHRDLKPDNILVETTADGSEIPRIVDFGIAVSRDRDDSVAGRRLTEANTVIGTPFYMSPEQARAKELDGRTDLFSLGVITYELLAGMPPFPGSSVDVALANASKDPPAIWERAGVEVDPLLESFARKLMARRREQRFSSAREALQVLELVERDRIAAARALSAVVEVAPLIAPNSEVLSTQPGTAITRVDKLTRIRRRSTAAAISVALGALLVVAGWSTHDDVRAPAIELAATTEATMPVYAVARVRAPHPEATPTTRIAHPMQARRSIVEPAPHLDATLPAPSVEPIVATPAAFQSPDCAAAVAAKYSAVGRALRGASPSLWEQYRRIRINAAMATVESRRETLVALAKIEDALNR